MSSKNLLVFSLITLWMISSAFGGFRGIFIIIDHNVRADTKLKA